MKLSDWPLLLCDAIGRCLLSCGATGRCFRAMQLADDFGYSYGNLAIGRYLGAVRLADVSEQNFRAMRLADAIEQSFKAM